MRATVAAAVCILSLGACRAESTGAADTGGADVAWRATATGLFNTCAVSTGEGRLACWGQNLLPGCEGAACQWRNRPRWLAAPPAVMDTLVASNGRHCGLTSGGDLYCWGSSLSATATDPPPGEVVRRITPGERGTWLTLGYAHVCIVGDSGAAYCWGDNFTGQLGTGDTARVRATPQRVAGTHHFAMVSAGTTHTCGVTIGGEGYCWGGRYGVLGVGVGDTTCVHEASCVTTNVPWRIAGDIRWRSISAGNAYTCGVSVEGRGYCWGALGFPQGPTAPYGILGTGSYEGSRVPVPLAGNLPALQSITTGTRHACAMTVTGEAYCWGNNEGGVLGRGTSGGRSATPAAVVGALRFRSLALSDYSCGLTLTGAIYCWGPNVPGWLGIGPSPLIQAVPARISEPAG